MASYSSEREMSSTICDVGKNLQESCRKAYVKTVVLKELSELTVEIEKFGVFQNVDEIVYKCCISTDRSTLITQVETTEEFLDTFVGCMPNLTKHHFIAKSQSKYVKDLKLAIPQEECIVLDFSENYSFIVQDATQGFNRENSQETVHPIIVLV